MRKFGILLCAAALLWLGSFEAVAEESDAPWWGADGDVRVATAFGNTGVGTDALDLNPNTNDWSEIDLQSVQKHHLRFAYIPMEWNGDTLLSLPIGVDAGRFDVSGRITSRAKLDTYQLSYRYDFHLGERVTLSPILQLSLVDGRIEIADRALEIGHEDSRLIPIPALGLRAELYPLSHIGVFAEGKGFTVGSQETMWDAECGVRLHPLPFLSLKASYRVLAYDVDYSGVEFDARMQGPFLAAALRF